MEITHLVNHREVPRRTVDILALACNLLGMRILSGGHCGWLRYEASDCPPTYLRFLPGERGRWLLRELVIDSSERDPLTAATLARVPVAAIEAYVNGDKRMHARLVNYLNVLSPVGGPPTGSNVALLASHYATTYGAALRDKVAADPAADWCALAALTTTEGAKHVVKKRRPVKRDELPVDADYRLTNPPGPDGLSAEFLDQVRRAYVAATFRGEPPNKTIAADVDASPRSVERWVYEARKRGIMTAARAKGARG